MSITKKTQYRFLPIVSALVVASMLSTLIPTAQAETKKINTEQSLPKPRILLKAARVFDGNEMHLNAAVLITGNAIVAVGDPNAMHRKDVREVDLGDSTILPGFIELHGHTAFQGIPHKTILEHGITTVRDVGGPLSAPSGGDGQLRLLTAGPMITVPGGYPTPVFGNHGGIATLVETPEQARQQVRDLVAGGAAVIKIALDPGGEAGAPWTTEHAPSTPPPWPMPSLEIVRAVTDEAHKNGKLVSAHVGENSGVELALQSGVDEWAHIPCAEISESLLNKAVQQKVKIITTIDTLSHCPGIHQNTIKLASLGAEFMYGAEIAHSEIPWGIDVKEIILMLHLTGMSPLEIFHTATAKAGDYLGLAPLGTLTTGAPADLIAARQSAR